KNKKGYTTMPGYVSFTLDDMLAVLDPLKFVEYKDLYTFEYVYHKTEVYEGKSYDVRVFTSIQQKVDTSRKAGADAIHVSVFNDKGRQISKNARINRTEHWR